MFASAQNLVGPFENAAKDARAITWLERGRKAKTQVQFLPCFGA